MEDRYTTISRDLYRTLVNEENLERFKTETANLKAEFAKISSDQIKWERYPFNRNYGLFDYQKCLIDPEKPTLLDVFEKFFKVFKDAPFWVEKYLAKGMKNFPRIIVSPTEIVSELKFGKLMDSDFKNSADDPLWLREPG